MIRDDVNTDGNNSTVNDANSMPNTYLRQCTNECGNFVLLPITNP